MVGQTISSRIAVLEARFGSLAAITDRILFAKDHLPELEATIAAVQATPGCRACEDRFMEVASAAYAAGGRA